MPGCGKHGKGRSDEGICADQKVKRSTVTTGKGAAVNYSAVNTNKSGLLQACRVVVLSSFQVGATVTGKAAFGEAEAKKSF